MSEKLIIDEVGWTVELNVSCPECDHYFDYLETDEYKEGGFEILNHVKTDNDANIKLNCPECGRKLLIKSTYY